MPSGECVVPEMPEHYVELTAAAHGLIFYRNEPQRCMSYLSERDASQWLFDFILRGCNEATEVTVRNCSRRSPLDRIDVVIAHLNHVTEELSAIRNDLMKLSAEVLRNG